MEKNNENAIEFYNGDKTCTVSITNQRYCNKLKKLYEAHPKEFERFVINADGSVYARLPLKWLKFSAPSVREVSEEQREMLRERMKQIARDRVKDKE